MKQRIRDWVARKFGFDKLERMINERAAADYAAGRHSHIIVYVTAYGIHNIRFEDAEGEPEEG